ncbi:S-adenosyl-L-methionine-dependent methyltransferase [Sistotremastrum suecicum HHB10207 ss-3]|uniref:S-adenosyl-L-methionine-dependent methyltransferase n=1 Tax=Sistotremastrum suecicum HHB10207 ss-3 TaxID=1314776 RepID=A0A166FT25_9AGAM|nr:S-adenosyl-L-methionine-dependent methyltransferase [Sistotremastrum suecicum HHB10207 ss-3]
MYREPTTVKDFTNLNPPIAAFYQVDEMPQNPVAPKPLRDLHGRGMNTLSEVYQLPADPVEFNRLDLQHRIWLKLMEGPVPFSDETLDDLLRGREGYQPALLDLGRGSGIWSIEMAQKFPHAKIVGFDLVESGPAALPNNCTFSTGDLTRGLQPLYEQFNLVHLRLVMLHIKGIEAKKAALKEAVGCLRPGGIIVILDYDECFLDEDKQPLRPAKDDIDADNSERSWGTRFWREVFERTDDGDVTEGEHIRSCLAEDVRIDKGSIQHEIFYMPIGWDGGDPIEGAEIGKMGFINFWDLARAIKPALLARGISSEIIDDWTSKADQELSGTPKKLFAAIRGTWARRL